MRRKITQSKEGGTGRNSLEKGLATSGTKAELVSRIIDTESSVEDEVEPEIQEEIVTEPEPVPPTPIAVPSTPAGLPVPPPVSARP